MKGSLKDLKDIEAEIGNLDQRLSELADAEHVPRKDSDKRLPTVLTQCDPSCPTCAMEREIGIRRIELGKLQRTALLTTAQESFREKKRQIDSAKRPRERKPNLWERGFRLILNEYPNIATANELRDLLRNNTLTYDDDDVGITLEGDSICVKNLKEGVKGPNRNKIWVVKIKNQQEYIRRVRSK